MIGFKNAEDLMRAFKFDQARESLAGLHPLEEDDHRKKAHLEAKILIFEGRYQEAKVQLLRTINLYDIHIGLLCDLAHCYKNLGQLTEWAEMVDRAELLLREEYDDLTVTERVRTHNYLCKAFEEQGKVYSALKQIEKSLQEVQNITEQQDYFRPFTLAQLLRLRACYFPKLALEPVYRELLSIKDVTRNLQIEIDHSLLLGEMQLFGPASVEAKLAGQLESLELDEDKRLFYFDYVEACLRMDQNPMHLDLTSPNMWERAIQRIALSPLLTWSEHELKQIFTLSSPISSLRFFLILYRKTPNENLKALCRTYMDLCLRGFSEQDRTVWLHFFETEEEIKKITLKVNVKQGTISRGTVSINLKSKSNLIVLAQLFSQNRSWDLPALVKHLWTEEYNSSYFHRLRMQAQRLNASLEPLTGVARTIQVNSKEASLAVDVELKVES